MQITDCLHPQRVFNRYTKEYVYAPCGKCAACRKHKVADWCQRLEQERYSWKYCVFFTLTYAPEYLPTLHCDESMKYFCDLSVKHVNPENGAILIDIEELLQNSDDPVKDKRWLDAQKSVGIGYLSKYDAQLFLKRVRINISRGIDAANKELNNKYYDEKEKVIRYYICGEYGETALRPHMHGLFFFNSEWTSSHISEIIYKSWKYGRVDSSFVKDTNTSYVAGYVNCTSNLPSILLHKSIRPFSLFSKCPFIGSLCHSSKEVQEIFYSASVDHVIFNHSTNVFDSVPLWRSYQNQLFPRLSFFDQIDSAGRVTLYGVFERLQKKFDCEVNFDIFSRYVRGEYTRLYRPSLISDYVTILQNGDDLSCIDGRLYSWYAVSRRVFLQSISFGISIKSYVSQINLFYQNVEKRKLTNQLNFESEYVKTNPLPDLLSLDRDCLNLFLNVDLSDLTEGEVLILTSYGVDIDKWYHPNLSTRNAYRSSFIPENLWSYRVHSLDSESWQKSAMKTKRKNEYLRHHPELLNVLW